MKDFEVTQTIEIAREMRAEYVADLLMNLKQQAKVLFQGMLPRQARSNDA
jgi:hypothetical protein